ncbi:MAG: metallophosphoesterase [Elusimicrobiota bacterium]|nr:metallophosphoesterase [Elusimicrobiota bacterium]
MIGIISDTHDNLDNIRKAVNYFNRQKVSLVLHAGDFVSPFTASEFKNLNPPMKGVYGNNDGDIPALMKKYDGIADILSGWRRLESGGKVIYLTHLPLPELPADCDLYIHGHTHEAEVKVKKGHLAVNPGDCSGWVSGRATIAVADLEKREAEIIEI